MTLQSMTGFARSTGTFTTKEQRYNWAWEIKSVNSKSLDIKIKTPQGFEHIHPQLKKDIEKHISRGSVSIFLDVKKENETISYGINQELLQQLISITQDLENTHKHISPSSVAQLLNCKGVIENKETSLDEQETQDFSNQLLQSFNDACALFAKDRQNEGSKLEKTLVNILEQIEQEVAKLQTIAQQQPQKLKEKLFAQIQLLSQGTDMPSEERLAQEALLIINKADTSEERERLIAHIKTCKELFLSSTPVGRRLDFLCQELNREANTTCSKSTDLQITQSAIEIKVLTEQFREQVQNIE